MRATPVTLTCIAALLFAAGAFFGSPLVDQDVRPPARTTSSEPVNLTPATAENAARSGSGVWLGATFNGGRAYVSRRGDARTGLVYLRSGRQFVASVSVPMKVRMPASGRAMRTAVGAAVRADQRLFVRTASGIVVLRSTDNDIEKLAATVTEVP